MDVDKTSRQNIREGNMASPREQSIRSMTGFGSAETHAGAWHLLIEIRSVNGRFFDFNVRCPDEIRVLEPWLREQVALSIQRGKVEVRIQVKPQATADNRLRLNPEILSQVLMVIQEIKQQSQDVVGFSPLELMRFPGICQETESIDQDSIIEAIKALMPKAIASIEQARANEGEKLAKFLSERIAGIRAHCHSLREQIPLWSKTLEQRFSERLLSLGYAVTPLASESVNQTDVPQSLSATPHSIELQHRIAQELSMYAVKADVAEELSRLSAHTDAVDEIIAKGGPCGKRLDFMMQELQREANTLGSKSQIIEQSVASVDLKVLIEQMREQIQNLE